MSRIIIFSLFLLNFQLLYSQTQIDISRLKSNFVRSENKEKYYSNLEKNIEQILSQKFDGNWRKWNKALRDAQSINYRSEILINAIKKLLDNEIDKFIKLQRTSLEIGYGYNDNLFSSQILNILKTSNDPISIAISAKYLCEFSGYKDDVIAEINKKSSSIKSTSIIIELLKDLNKESQKFPNLSTLLNHNFQTGKTILFSFHRKNRKYPGLTIVRNPNKKFEKNDDGSIFYIRQLALSYSNLPYYIPNGNTPQGIFSIVGQYISPTETIGPTPNVLVRGPFEVSPDIFYHNKNKCPTWCLGDFKNLLPLEWKKYSPIFESFYAGKIGRKLIIIHGSTDETEYFKNENYYPLTPTRGCLSSLEKWNENDGTCVKSEQLELINTIRKTKQISGYLIVIELDDKNKPVEIEEIAKYLK